ncbi:MAG: adenine deaminase C-terminal domain-containing protein [Candidatus Binatia bacterium]
MARCANALLKVGDGIAVADRGEILGMFKFPFGGLFSPEPWRSVASGLRRIQTLLKEMGSSFDKPIFALNFCRS